MGANPYLYVTPWCENPAEALEALRQREFAAGRYDYALQHADPPTFTFKQQFPPTDGFPSPGARHPTIEAARLDAMEAGSGTGSILDIVAISAEPGLCWASPLAAADVTQAFGTPQPTRADLDAILWRKGKQPPDPARFGAFWDAILRGEARYFALYQDGAPTEWVFAGVSID